MVAEFRLNQGQCLTFFLRHMERGDRAELLVTKESGEEAFRHTMDFWRRWLAQMPLYKALARDGAPFGLGFKTAHLF